MSTLLTAQVRGGNSVETRVVSGESVEVPSLSMIQITWAQQSCPLCVKHYNLLWDEQTALASLGRGTPKTAGGAGPHIAVADLAAALSPSSMVQPCVRWSLMLVAAGGPLLSSLPVLLQAALPRGKGGREGKGQPPLLSAHFREWGTEPPDRERLQQQPACLLSLTLNYPTHHHLLQCLPPPSIPSAPHHALPLHISMWLWLSAPSPYRVLGYLAMDWLVMGEAEK